MPSSRYPQIIREALDWWLVGRSQTEKLHRDEAFAALDALEAEANTLADTLEAAANTAAEGIAALCERVDALEAELEQLRRKLAREQARKKHYKAELARKTEALRKIAGMTNVNFDGMAPGVARAVLGEDE